MADKEREYYLQIIAEQNEKIRMLSERVEELTNAINAKKHKKDSHNSSKPPSSDGYNKPAPKSLRKKSDKKQGAQSGHAGKGMPIKKEPDQIVMHLPEKCTNCPHKDNCNFSCSGTHYTYDIDVVTKLIAHKTYRCSCPIDSKNLSGEFPVEAAANKQYGAGLRAFVVSLLTQGYVSIDRTKQLIEGLGVPISTGTIQNMLAYAGQKVLGAVEIIRQKVAALHVLHCDETGADVNGKLHWIHCICNPKWSYCVIHEKRGSEAMDDIGILSNLSDSIVIHDFWMPYLKYKNIQHGFCNTHLERELIYVYEMSNQEWAKNMNTLLSEMCAKRSKLIKSGAMNFEAEVLEDYFKRYDEYLEDGIRLNPIPSKVKGKKGRPAKGKIRCLIDRMIEFKDDILRFSTDWEVPFTNNEAERCVRFTKVKQKVSGCFRTRAGADNFMDIMSYIGSAKKHNVSVYDALRKAFEGRAAGLVHSWE